MINERADRDRRVVVSKDTDFRDSHLLRHTPRRLLEVNTGNIGNADLLDLFTDHLPSIASAFEGVGPRRANPNRAGRPPSPTGGLSSAGGER